MRSPDRPWRACAVHRQGAGRARNRIAAMRPGRRTARRAQTQKARTGSGRFLRRTRRCARARRERPHCAAGASPERATPAWSSNSCR